MHGDRQTDRQIHNRQSDGLTDETDRQEDRHGCERIDTPTRQDRHRDTESTWPASTPARLRRCRSACGNVFDPRLAAPLVVHLVCHSLLVVKMRLSVDVSVCVSTRGLPTTRLNTRLNSQAPDRLAAVIDQHASQQPSQGLERDIQTHTHTHTDKYMHHIHTGTPTQQNNTRPDLE